MGMRGHVALAADELGLWEGGENQVEENQVHVLWSRGNSDFIGKGGR